MAEQMKTKLLTMILFLLPSICLASSALLPEAYGQIVEDNDTGTTLTVATAGTWYPWISAEAGEGTGSVGGDLVTTTTGNPSSVITGSRGEGAYRVNYHISLDGPGSAVVEVAVFKNGTKMNNTQTHIKIDTAGRAEFTLSASSVTQTNANTTFDLRLTSDSNADDLTIYHAYLGIQRIGPKFTP